MLQYSKRNEEGRKNIHACKCDVSNDKMLKRVNTFCTQKIQPLKYQHEGIFFELLSLLSLLAYLNSLEAVNCLIFKTCKSKELKVLIV